MAEYFANAEDKLTSGKKATPGYQMTNNVSSPLSGGSSDTLHDNESFGDERKRINISPLSTATLNFDDLKIHNDGFSSSHKDVEHVAASFQGSVKHRYPPSYARPVQQFRRNNHNPELVQSPFRGESNPRNARAWISEESRAAQEFLVVRNSMKRLFKNADVAKWKAADYVAHREAMMASAVKSAAQRAQDTKGKSDLRVPPIPPQQQDMLRRCGLFGNFDQIGNYGRALGEKTIWCEDWQSGKDEIAPWPSVAELKWEGDDRAKTGVGRYPPLPREQGPVGLPWNQLQAVEQYPLDQIARVPTMEDVYLPVDEIDDEIKHDLLSKDLEDAIDAYLES